MSKLVRVGTCDGCKRPGIEPAPCCRSMKIGYRWPAPDDEQEKEFLRWLLSHEGVSWDAEGYDVVVKARCHWLTEEGDCAIYENRPQLCRDWPYDPSCLEDIPQCAFRFEETS